uniref:Uncharacterized protein n=1 Tax=Rhodococcus hoagii TaxID=43767 RepID=Q9ETM9_RHOHA|nr:unknown [Prescottella equi]ADI50252.1 hypothetical protein pVAPA_0710 [Prescottella equi]BAB16625.1 hypothetical protein [Prescottella equi]CAQ30412.1 hypothetical protein pVAPA_0710 [Prescottella equi]
MMSLLVRLNIRTVPPRSSVTARCPSHLISNAHPSSAGGSPRVASIGAGGAFAALIGQICAATHAREYRTEKRCCRRCAFPKRSHSHPASPARRRAHHASTAIASSTAPMPATTTPARLASSHPNSHEVPVYAPLFGSGAVRSPTLKVIHGPFMHSP